MGITSTVISTMLFVVLFVAAVGLANSANVICTDYGKDVGGGADGPTEGFEGYYKRPVPDMCRGRHGALNGWVPRYRIDNPHSNCPGGWRKYKKACYYNLNKRHGNRNFRQAEEFCNQHKGHIFFPNSREEFMWVRQHQMQHKHDWYWMGVYCAKERTDKLEKAFLVTGEDIRVVNRVLKARIYPGRMIDANNKQTVVAHSPSDNWWFTWDPIPGHHGLVPFAKFHFDKCKMLSM